MAAKKINLPFGPQHPVLPEPIQLKLVLEDEKVVEAVPNLGYVHRGLEGLVDKKDFNQMIYVVERICGICSFQHGMTLSLGIESLMDIEVPERANYLRVVWGELHRTHSHLLWLGLMVEAFGFESLFMQTWRIREKIMDILEATAGARVIISTSIPGGVRRDISAEQTKWILGQLDEVEKELKYIEKVFLDDYTVKQRTVGLGVLTKEVAHQYAVVGPTMRASGIKQDCRTLGYAAYNELDWEPIVMNDGDCYTRMAVRLKEVFLAINLTRQALTKMPEGEINVKVKGNPPAGEALVRVEQPRGELVTYVKGNGTKHLDRIHVRTPTFANVPSLLAMLPGCELADVPVIILTIDPCVSCVER
ncbi:NADH-quinone oxidoreductase subunit D [Desulfitispora alkaliphila]|uniref:hydrogenase large subunit n=1 Tax=Desulfitispora alkaliphila TaxID=622674 RepID=UPI003D1ECFF2